MVGLVYATRREALPLLARPSVRPLAERPFLTFRIDGASHPAAIVVISGMGKVAAAIAAGHLITVHQASHLVSAGLCGCLIAPRPWPIGGLLRVRSAVEGDCDRFGRGEPAVDCDTSWFGHLEAARLVTCDRPVFDPVARDRLAALGDLVDMEGAAVARTAQRYGISCAQIKGISDGADTGGRRDVARHIDRVAAAVADALDAELVRQSGDKRWR